MDSRIAIVYNNFACIISMNGKKRYQYLSNLGGKKSNPCITPKPILDMQQTIMDNIIFPLVNSQWNTIQENLFLIDILKARVNNYINYYNMPSLILYKDILTIYSKVLNEHIQLTKHLHGIYAWKWIQLLILFLIICQLPLLLLMRM